METRRGHKLPKHEQDKIKALDDEIDEIMGEDIAPRVLKKKFGARKNQNGREMTIFSQKTGFGKAERKTNDKTSKTWAENANTLDFTVSKLSASRNIPPYSTSNQFSSKFRSNLPSSRIVPGKALLGSEEKKKNTTAIYSAPHKSLTGFSKPQATGVLETCSRGKEWTLKRKHLTPPGNKPVALVRSAAPRDFKNTIFKTNQKLSMPIPKKISIDDDTFVFTKKRLMSEDEPRRVVPPLLRRESMPVSRRLENGNPQLNESPAGRSADNAIQLCDDSEEETSESATDELELECLLIYMKKPLREKRIQFKELSIVIGIKEISFDFVDEFILSKTSRCFLVVKLIPGHDEQEGSFLLVQPANASSCFKLERTLRRIRGSLIFKQIDQDDRDYSRYEILLRDETKGSMQSNVILTYPMERDASDLIMITQEDLLKLNPREYLNDNLVDYYLKWLLAEKLPGAASYTICLTSHFFSLLRKQYKNVATWFPQGALLEKQVIIIPINMKEHWSLAMIFNPRNFTQDNQEKTVIALIDSFGNFHNRNKIYNALKKFFIRHSQGDENEMEMLSNGFEMIVLDGPRQRNGTDCGVYMLLAAQYILEQYHERKESNEKYDLTSLIAKNSFTQKDVNETRRRILVNLETSAAKYAELKAI